MVAIVCSSVALFAVSGSEVITVAAAGLLLLGILAFLVVRILERSQRRPEDGQRFWTFYGINDRLYRNADRKRLNWSQERFRHHRFRWQSGP